MLLGYSSSGTHTDPGWVPYLGEGAFCINFSTADSRIACFPVPSTSACLSNFLFTLFRIRCPAVLLYRLVQRGGIDFYQYYRKTWHSSNSNAARQATEYQSTNSGSGSASSRSKPRATVNIVYTRHLHKVGLSLRCTFTTAGTRTAKRQFDERLPT